MIKEIYNFAFGLGLRPIRFCRILFLKFQRRGCNFTIYMKSGNKIRFHAEELRWKYSDTDARWIRELTWKASDLPDCILDAVDVRQIEGITHDIK